MVDFNCGLKNSFPSVSIKSTFLSSKLFDSLRDVTTPGNPNSRNSLAINRS